MKKRDNVREKKKEHSITKKEKLINNMREDKREKERVCVDTRKNKLWNKK